MPECKRCKGTGKLPCPNPDCTDGTDCGSALYPYSYPCARCNGTGEIDCPNCHGEGYVVD